ncbi:MAG: endopeptidase La [Bryobacteraceae bacterium]|nr:endopeptidase La [Bryobacteraceae bacterium]MDW8377182.1 endopeptidase La [Bryobacterales bacterium]
MEKLELEVKELPVLALKNVVLFPQLLLPLTVGRPASLAAVEAALKSNPQEIILVTQRDPAIENPTQDDLYTVGTRAIIRRHARNDEQMEVFVLGVERVVIIKLDQTGDYPKVRYRPLPLPTDSGPEVEALHGAVNELTAKAISLAQAQPSIDLERLISTNDDPLRLVYLVASMLSLDPPKAQALLEAPTRLDALRLMHTYLSYEVQVLELRAKIASQARSEMTKEQREYLLRQQMRAIQQELGEKDGEGAEIEMLREQLEKADLPEEVRKEANRELKRLERLPPAAPDYHVIRTYLEYVLELPWKKYTEDNLDIAHARRVLDEDHYELKKVKERILEHLAVLKLNPGAKAPILCFVGPPGTGKTSLGQSIARALGRKFERFSVGGMHDEAELRGHRRTYIGALPGRVIQALRRAGAANPVILLDEVDKLGRDYRGDPAAALLEILDPEQNNKFRDNYLDLPFDLSKVMFIATANGLDTVPKPLLDRMEILRLAGYSHEEKIEIAKRYLIPRQLKETGLTEEQLRFTDEAILALVEGYTREAGLRRLEQNIGRVARKIALRVAEGKTEPFLVKPENLQDLLGPEIFHIEQMRRQLEPGVAAGLAWTESGGDVLYVEATLLPDGKGLTLTGQLGEVMQESARAAQSYIWSHASILGIDTAKFKDCGVHVHVPAGAVPKDGPSAGITVAVALASLYTGFAARGDTAMTGEITLTGLVLPIGGLKEKVLAARRAGIKRIILPKANVKDLIELPEPVRQEIEFIPCDRIQQVLRAAIPQLAEQLAVAA